MLLNDLVGPLLERGGAGRGESLLGGFFHVSKFSIKGEQIFDPSPVGKTMVVIDKLCSEPGGLRHHILNWKVPGSNPNRSSPRPWNPTLLRGPPRDPQVEISKCRD